MPKFFIDAEYAENEVVALSQEDSSHILRSLRREIGDTLSLGDTAGFDYTARIERVENHIVFAKILKRTPSQTELPFEVFVYQAVPKGSKMDLIIQKNTELGVRHIIPFQSEFCVSDIRGKEDKKIARWQKIAEEAAKQSGRAMIPTVHTPLTFPQAIEAMSAHDICFAAYESSDQHQLRQILLSKSDVKSIGFIVGSEGGFSSDEVLKMQKLSIPTISLGKRILRTETAATAISSMILYELGDVNQ